MFFDKGLLNINKIRYYPRLILLCVVLLSGCTTGYAPVSDRNATSINTAKKAATKPPNEIYRVQKGDTLYSIAWRYGLDYRHLARVNNINSQYVIYLGQPLKLTSKNKNQTKPSINVSSINSKNKVSAKGVTSKKTSLEKTRKNSNKSSKNKAVNPPRKEKNKTVVSKTSTRKVTRWRWPATGSVISGFSSKNKGIDISGNHGDPVYATAAGKVVYAGNGILGYGNLVIINHNEEYLSAYAHNSVILVVENDQIKAGKKIAEIGSSGTIQTILHFEIRRDGKPVNPLLYLPKQ